MVFLDDLTFLHIFTTVLAKMSQNLYLHEFCAKKGKNRVLSWLDSFTAYYNYISKIVKKLITPRDLYTSITNRVPMWSEHFTAYSNCMSEKVTKLVSPRVLCTNVAKRFLTWFDRFTAYYNCMSKNVGKLISPRVLCTSVKIVFLGDLTVSRLITTV